MRRIRRAVLILITSALMACPDCSEDNGNPDPQDTPDPEYAIETLEQAVDTMLSRLSGPDVKPVLAFEAFELGTIVYDDGQHLYHSSLNMYPPNEAPTPTETPLSDVEFSFTWHREFNLDASAKLALEKVSIAEFGVEAVFKDERVDKLEVTLGYDETRTRMLRSGFDDKEEFEASRESIPGNAVVVGSLEARTRFGYAAFDSNNQSVDVSPKVIMLEVNQEVGGQWAQASSEQN